MKEDGIPIKEICASANIPELTFYYWKNKYLDLTATGYDLLDVKDSKIKELTREVAELKDQIKVLKGICEPFKKIMKRNFFENEISGVDRQYQKQYVDFLIDKWDYPASLACNIVGINFSTYRYESIGKPDAEIYERLEELAEEFPQRSCRYYIRILKEEGRSWNHKRIERIFKALNLDLAYGKYL